MEGRRFPRRLKADGSLSEDTMAFEITEVRIRIVDNPRGSLLAHATITVDGCFAVHGVGIIRGPNGVFASMPSRPNPKYREGEAPRNGERPVPKYLDIAHPINAETRKYIEDKVLDVYEAEVNRGGSRAPASENAAF